MHRISCHFGQEDHPQSNVLAYVPGKRLAFLGPLPVSGPSNWISPRNCYQIVTDRRGNLDVPRDLARSTHGSSVQALLEFLLPVFEVSGMNLFL